MTHWTHSGTTASPDTAHWQRRLTEIAIRQRIPGAVLAIAHGDNLIEVAHGVLNVATGVPTTTDSLFQIGSITKVWTATAVMRLVDQGTLDLDVPLIDLFPELAQGDSAILDRVTMRHLLTHTSGIDGDVFTDTGRGDDCLRRYVAELAGVGRIHPIDATWSYCNSGFTLAGRVIELITGTTWDTAMRELLFEPLGLRHTVTLPEEALLHRAAVGHLAGPDGTPRRADRWYLPRSSGPAGAIAATARDVLTFAGLHLNDGVGPDGERLLSSESVRRMAQEQLAVPFMGEMVDSWGIGWWRGDWHGARMIGHNGGTIGQTAQLQILPEQRLTIVVLTNGSAAQSAFTELSTEIAAELAGVRTPEPFAPPSEPPSFDPARYVGCYERSGVRHEIRLDDTELVLKTTFSGELAEVAPVPSVEQRLTPVATDLFAARSTFDQDVWQRVTFHTIADGTRYLHLGGRAAEYVASEA
ncbi:serine hydrolase domain-containing protein [Nocardia arthritidis]|uniref:serine hydrolase domain-containing protein n=1 Tax=Nocardia arthritidis TaxID=228602 RepID=UPI00142E6755|nr:serine hydrolase domain-containing protein [Nocardia arthritidis]